MNKSSYDVIVVGAGHAGCEACLAAARLGCSTLLITFEKDKIGYLSCNPAVGGIGKGQLVKEIDALGGEMAKATDAAGIQFRMLNTSRGPAVHSSRAQVDRDEYALYIQNVLQKQKNLDILEAEALELIIENGAVKGITTTNGEYPATSVVLCPGTFLNGKIHIGLESFPAGRIEEKRVSSYLSKSLKKNGFRIIRFKTGTCARIDGRSIVFDKLKAQYGDEPPLPFSFSTKSLHINQVPCHITHTTEKTHEIIRANLDRSPLFTGKIVGTGVRYCPSLEDKIVKFPHHPTHHVFLEPEGKHTQLYYPNGISTSLPIDVQNEFIHTIPGLEKAEIVRYGYGIEHDVVEPTELSHILESEKIKNLFLAGQINGTTGYEEAAAQGLIAGINAALKVKHEKLLALDRTNSYIGVLIDDLVTKGTNEPYRMFTSRVEYRLMIREDNADLRLRKFGYRIGLVSAELNAETEKKMHSIKEGKNTLKEIRIFVEEKKINLLDYLKRPGISIADIMHYLPAEFPEAVFPEIKIDIKYQPYIERQLKEISGFRKLENIRIPKDFDFHSVHGLSLEIIEKLSGSKPDNLGQANRISGITPSAITTLILYLKKHIYQKKQLKTKSGN